MRNTSELPEFTPAGRANILMSVARLSGGAYIEPPIERSPMPAFVWGLVIGAGVAVAVAAMTWGV